MQMALLGWTCSPERDSDGDYEWFHTVGFPYIFEHGSWDEADIPSGNNYYPFHESLEILIKTMKERGL